VISPESTSAPTTQADKRRPDLYHTCNNLSGLSIAQHPQTHSRATVESNKAAFDMTKGLPAVTPTTPGGGWKDEQQRQEVRKEIWANALGWIDNGPEIVLGGKASRLVCSSSPLGELWLMTEYDYACVQYPRIEVEAIYQLFLWSAVD